MPLFGPPNVDKLKTNQNVKGLIKALGYEKDRKVRKAAAEALGQIGDARAVTPLIAALMDVTVSYEAKNALTKMGALAVDDLVIALGNKDTRSQARMVLGKIGNAALDSLITALKHKNEDVRAASASALGEIGNNRAVKPLIVATKDKSEDVRAKASIALGKIGDTRAFEHLTGLLNDESDFVRTHTIGALGDLGNPRSAKLLIPAFQSEDKFIRLSAARALGQIGDEIAIEPLEDMLSEDDEWDVRKAAAESLKKLGWQPQKDEAGASFWLATGNWEKCAMIGEPAVGVIVNYLKSTTSSNKRQKALNVLRTMYNNNKLKQSYREIFISEAKKDGMMHQDRDVHQDRACSVGDPHTDHKRHRDTFL